MHIDDNYVKLQIWDTAGQERFRGITKSYYKGANAIILVYDITAPKSFEDVTSYWMKETRQYSPEDRIYCFINKCDKGEETQIPPEHLAFLEENKIKWFKVSAKERYNVSDAIIEMARETMNKETKILGTQGVNMGLAESHQRH
jgi:small GTP-binding protein